MSRKQLALLIHPDKCSHPRVEPSCLRIVYQNCISTASLATSRRKRSLPKAMGVPVRGKRRLMALCCHSQRMHLCHIDMCCVRVCMTPPLGLLSSFLVHSLFHQRAFLAARDGLISVHAGRRRHVAIQSKVVLPIGSTLYLKTPARSPYVPSPHPGYELTSVQWQAVLLPALLRSFGSYSPAVPCGVFSWS